MSSPNVAKYGTIETGSVVEVGGRLNRREEGEDSRAGKPLVIETDFGSNVNWDKIQSTKLLLGLAYGIASGTLSGLCLLFAKTGIDLLILTVIGHNQVCFSSAFSLLHCAEMLTMRPNKLVWPDSSLVNRVCPRRSRNSPINLPQPRPPSRRSNSHLSSRLLLLQSLFDSFRSDLL